MVKKEKRKLKDSHVNPTEKSEFINVHNSGYTAKSWFDKKDLLLCGSLILVFIFIGIWNIGSLNTPVTGWIPEKANESFYVSSSN